MVPRNSSIGVSSHNRVGNIAWRKWDQPACRCAGYIPPVAATIVRVLLAGACRHYTGTRTTWYLCTAKRPSYVSRKCRANFFPRSLLAPRCTETSMSVLFQVKLSVKREYSPGGFIETEAVTGCICFCSPVPVFSQLYDQMFLGFTVRMFHAAESPGPK